MADDGANFIVGLLFGAILGLVGMSIVDDVETNNIVAHHGGYKDPVTGKFVWREGTPFTLEVK